MLAFIKRPVTTLYRATLIAVVPLFFTLVVTGIIAKCGGVFYKQDLKKKLQKAERSYDCLEVTWPFCWIANTRYEERKKTSDKIANENPTLLPFYLYQQNYLWPATWICLLWLLRLFSPQAVGFVDKKVRATPVSLWKKIKRRHKWRTRLSLKYKSWWSKLWQLTLSLKRKSWRRRIQRNWYFLGVIIWILYRAPNVIDRNILGTDEGRKVYAYTHRDVHLASFLWQEVVIGIFCIFMILVWKKWSDFFVLQRIALIKDKRVQDPIKNSLDSKRLNKLTSLFGHWQWCSLILALGFGFFTNFYWNFVTVIGDKRYVASAVIAHILWGVTWLIMSLPLMITWQDWEQTQKEALAFIAQNPPNESTDRASLTEAITKLQPFNTINLALTGIGAFVSFVSPLIKLLFEK